MLEILKIIDSIMAKLAINYEYMEWKSDIVYPYFVGEYIESDTDTEPEDGQLNSTFILSGFGRSTWKELEEQADKIKDFLKSSYTTITDGGSGVAISYGYARPIRTGEMELKRMEINLTVKEWRV